eukprot:CAMPEP_0194170642 /NCGR_PEP_ID=MMETSP0154-20130528/5292_1 /TAXON_ID=1049557 /ORGANISM="Thalassiothrix antarctica, Strain L6-D1" /LENGTH=415 /DNA_ID=CAMNT_0038882589 /DNA_START=6 /DNA_END=1253 /DNA_ORIENTATION=-
MRPTLNIFVLFALCHSRSNAFTISNTNIIRRNVVRNKENEKQLLSSSRLFSSKDDTPTKKKKLGLLTFDLDDTLYPIDIVQSEANAAFVQAMERFGYSGIDSEDIDTTAKMIRLEEMSQEEAAQTTHTGIRELAIRRELEKAMLSRKLQEVAEDWATPVSALADVVVSHAKKWTRTAVSPSVVSSILNSWEMERHHAAERNLYPEVVDFLAQLKKDHPEMIIGAVTDGKANPMFMTFTLSKYFDFVCSWEDDQANRARFFVDLANVDEKAELSWIYEATRYKYAELKDLTDKINTGMSSSSSDTQSEKDDILSYPAEYDDLVWIHVGDDLAYDVGGSSQCGAKTIYCELAPRYSQTSRCRFENLSEQPKWATSSKTELENRCRLNKKAETLVDEQISYLTDLPKAIDRILEEREA